MKDNELALLIQAIKLGVDAKRNKCLLNTEVKRRQLATYTSVCNILLQSLSKPVSKSLQKQVVDSIQDPVYSERMLILGELQSLYISSDKMSVNKFVDECNRINVLAKHDHVYAHTNLSSEEERKRIKVKLLSNVHKMLDTHTDYKECYTNIVNDLGKGISLMELITNNTCNYI